jgi:hypothetical protein
MKSKKQEKQYMKKQVEDWILLADKDLCAAERWYTNE